MIKHIFGSRNNKVIKLNSRSFQCNVILRESLNKFVLIFVLCVVVLLLCLWIYNIK